LLTVLSALTRSVPRWMTGAGAVTLRMAGAMPCVWTLTVLTAASESLRLPSARVLRPCLSGSWSATRAAAGAITVRLSLMNRELRRLAFRRLSFGSRQRGTNQAAMDRSFVFACSRFL
jgi:hypothetical protein